MTLLALLVFVGVLILIITPTHRLTARQIACAAFALFILRAGGCWLGRYVLERTGGPLQIPAYFLVMLGWPEIAVAATLGWPANREHALIMATGLLALTSCLLAVVVYLRTRWSGQPASLNQSSGRHTNKLRQSQPTLRLLVP